MLSRTIIGFLFAMGVSLFAISSLSAQTAPDQSELAAYSGLHAAAATGDLDGLKRLIARGADLNDVDSHGRTPLMVAGYKRDVKAAELLIASGASVNALDSERYDLITIAAVADDLAMLQLAIRSGGNAAQVTSPYEGTALIAAAHLGHVEIVRALIDAKAPLDHVNNLDWTALIESIVLGDGGRRHVACLKALVEAGANVNIPDGTGATPLALARRAGYTDMVRILEAAGAKP
jgi:ankyrin repeat protein